jgi:hypothetical protein
MKNILITALLLALLAAGPALQPASASPSVSGDPYVDELLTNGCESQSPYWLEVKEQLTNGNIDAALDLCRKTMARRELDIDMHCLYAMSLEMKYRRSTHDPALFDECVKEWTHVAKAKILAPSRGWDNIGEGEVFGQNQERKAMANKHLEALVGRAPGFFETEKAFVEKAIRIRTEVAGKLKTEAKQM